MSDPVYINGKVFSFASTKLKIDGEEFTGYRSIKWSHKIEEALAYGAGRAYKPRGRTSGKYNPEAITISMYIDSLNALRKQLAQRSRSGKSYGGVIFQMSLSFVEDGQTPHFVEFTDCRLTGESPSVDETAEATMIDVEIKPIGIKHDGLTLYDDGGTAS